MKKYFVRWRLIRPDDMFTPVMYLPIEHTTVEAKEDARQWDIMEAVSKEFPLSKIFPEHVSIEDFQPL